MVLDTDTANEIDDQFAIAWALASPERLNVEAIYAAPFFASWHPNSTSPEDGMHKSYDEILRVLDCMDINSDNFVYKGATTFLPEYDTPVANNDAVEDLIKRARQPGLLYVVAIGAITNIASAILSAPDIIENIVIVWLGSHPDWWPDTKEFNHMQDIPAVRAVFDSGVPIVHVPCMGVASHLITSPTELEAEAKGKGRIGDFLYELVADYEYRRGQGWSKVIWDLGPVAWMINPAWIPTQLTHAPIPQADCTWSYNKDRHLIRQAYFANRDLIYHDFFKKRAATA